jgi:hypothetical protein
MKRKLPSLLILAVVLSLVAVVPVSAKAPLTGEMELQFKPGMAGTPGRGTRLGRDHHYRWRKIRNGVLQHWNREAI